jgi:hypothetical protein
LHAVRSIGDVMATMDRFHRDLPTAPGLIARLGQAHAYYVIPDENGFNRFGFSKFLGYRGQTAESYLAQYKELSGINTEHALKDWFDEVKPGSTTYRMLFEELVEWMGKYGKKPRGGQSQYTRLMVIKPEFIKEAEEMRPDRRLLDLMIAVADLLPLAQRNQLRSVL